MNRSTKNNSDTTESLGPMDLRKSRKLGVINLHSQNIIKNRGLFSTKLKASTSKLNYLTLEKIRDILKKHGKDRAYRIIMNESRRLKFEPMQKKDFDIEFKRLDEFMKKKMKNYSYDNVNSEKMKKSVIRDTNQYMLKYHDINLFDHVGEVKAALSHIGSRAHTYFKYLILGKGLR